MRRLLVWGVLVSALASAQEGTKHSEFFWQPDEGQHALRLEGNLTNEESTETSPGNAPTEVKVDGFSVKGNYDFGLMDFLSFGVGVGWVKVEAEVGPSSFHIVGWQDIQPHIRGFMDLDGMIFYFGVEGVITVRSNSSSTDPTSGRNTVRPYVGLQMGSDLKFGAKVAYDVIKTEGVEKKSSGDEVTNDGRQLSVSAFGELDFGGSLVGASATLNFHGGETVVTPQAPVPVVFEAHKELRAEAYAKIALGRFDLLPAFEYYKRLDESELNMPSLGSSGVRDKKLSGWLAKLAARFYF